jgi:hypothetical protein
MYAAAITRVFPRIYALDKMIVRIFNLQLTVIFTGLTFFFMFIHTHASGGHFEKWTNF